MSATLSRNRESAVPATVVVDGVVRPAQNSLGHPIHPTQAGIENFWRWFGDSKAVDPKTGAPLVLYHGTASDFHAFDPDLSDSKAKTGAPAGTFFFTDAPDIASSYTVKWQGDFSHDLHAGANVMPVYLKIDRPLKANARGNNWRDIPHKGDWVDTNDIAALAKDLRRYDSAIIRNVSDKGVGNTVSKTATTFVATDPRQIKSALGNSGAFSPHSGLITDTAPPQAKPTIHRSFASRLLSLDEALSPASATQASALSAGPR